LSKEAGWCCSFCWPVQALFWISKTVQIARGQQASIIDADQYLLQYLAEVRSKPAAERAALYAKYVYEPVLKRCGEGGEYYEFGRHNLIRIVPAEQ
jgi:hypothetical protein